MYNKFVHLLNLLVNGAKYSTLSINLTSPVFINFSLISNWKYQDYQFQQLHISTNYFDVSLVRQGQTVTIRCKTIC